MFPAQHSKRHHLTAFRKTSDSIGKSTSVSDNCCCDTKWIQYPFGDSGTERSRRPVTAKDRLIELSGATVRKRHMPSPTTHRHPHIPPDTKSNKVRLLLTTVCLTLDSPPLCTIRTNVMSPFRWKITSLCQIKKNRMCVALLWLCTSNTGQVLFKHSS